MTERELWTGFERHGDTWYAMYCNVDLDQAERNTRPDLVWMRNDEIAALRRPAPAAPAPAGPDPVCGTCGGSELICYPRENIEHEHDDGCRCPDSFHAALAAAREGEK